MKKVDILIEQALTTPSKSGGCGCGCGCGGKKIKSPVLKESKVKDLLSEGLTYHIDNKISLSESKYKVGSEEHLSLIRESRKLYSRGIIEVSETDKELLQTDLGHFGEYKGEIVPLDLPMLNEDSPNDFYNQLHNFTEDLHDIIWAYKSDFSNPTFMISVKNIMNDWDPLLRQSDIDIKSYIEKIISDAFKMEKMNEAEYKGREVELNKPMAGDVKKFKVYVKNPKGNVVKVNFGQKGVKIKKSNPERRKSFRARHNCDNPGPKHKARYWSCRKW